MAPSFSQPLNAKLVTPGSFEVEKHFYPRVLNATLHPMIKMFMGLGNERIAQRYCHLHPETDIEKLKELLRYVPSYFYWAGSDLFTVTNEKSQRQLIVIETNSCPSGQKSFPFDDDSSQDNTGFQKLASLCFKTVVETKCKMTKEEGSIAVLFDKNPMEATGYAASLADALGENVYLTEMYNGDPNPPTRFDDGVLHVRTSSGEWVPIRAAFRYVTQKPWNRIPISSKTLIFNPVITCLSGARNKLVAAKAYEFLNRQIEGYGLAIRSPETITDVNLNEIPLYVKSMGMHAVIKNPYSNAGQGVYTITSKEELDHHYQKFIVQSLVGNSGWSSKTRSGVYYHAGTVPNRKGDTYVFDLRMMVTAGPNGFLPTAIYARRAEKPLSESLENSGSSWSMLGTNLSEKAADGSWTTDTNRLLLMDNKDFNRLGIGIDDVIDGYVQTVLSSIAIDRMCKRLVDSETGSLNVDLFHSLNQDEALIGEIIDA